MTGAEGMAQLLDALMRIVALDENMRIDPDQRLLYAPKREEQIDRAIVAYSAIILGEASLPSLPRTRFALVIECANCAEQVTELMPVGGHEGVVADWFEALATEEGGRICPTCSHPLFEGQV